MSRHGALGSATIVVTARVLSSIVTLALGVLSASYFGTSAAKDCFLVAQGIPTFVTTILVGGVYASLMVALAEIGARNGVSAQRAFATATLVRLLGGLIPAALLVAVVAGPLVHLIAPGFPAAQVETTASLLRVSLLGSLGGFVLVIARCLFETRSHFAESGAANILTGLASLGLLVALVGRFGVFAQAWGTVLGTWCAAAFLGLLAFVRLKDPPSFIARTPGSTEQSAHHRFLWSAFVPLSLGATFGQVNILIDNAFASYLPAGNITVLSFAYVIVSNVVLLTAWPIVEVYFPRMAAASHQDSKSLIEELRAGQRYMLLLMAPIAAGAVSFGTPLARLLFERKAFGPQSTHAVATTLACYGLDILLMGSVLLQSRLLFARRRLKLVAWTAIGAILLNVLLDAVLVRFAGIYGIALATSAVTLGCFLFLRVLVNSDVGMVNRGGDVTYAIKVIGSALLVGLSAWAWALSFERLAGIGSELLRGVEVFGGLSIGAAVYLASLKVAGVREGADLVRRFWNMLSRPRLTDTP